jgi:ectoine hydroxylase-related dioxygenase (phytanoyl-CoA dioxygenase family)
MLFQHHKLTEREMHSYEKQGFLVVPDLLSKEEVNELGKVVTELVSQAAGLESGDEFYDLEPSHSKDDPRVRRLKKPTQQHEIFNRMARHPAILDVIEQLIGPGIRMTHPDGKVNIKAAGYGSPVEWHQDLAGYPHTNDNLLSATISMDDIETENGPILMVPGSHRGPLYSHHSDGVFCSAINLENDPLDLESAVPLLGKAGVVTFHHCRIVHGSALNTSERSRRLLIYQYGANDSWPLTGSQTLNGFTSTILRGEMVDPRMTATPVRLPLPVAPNYDGLYTSQENAKSRYFATHEANPGKKN